MKKGHNNVRMPDEQVIAFLEEVLVEQGYALPLEPEYITSEDLALYGKGTPRTLDVLRQSFECLMRRQFVADGTARHVSESLAMAARNGTRISDAVWTRMRADREKTEAKGERRE
jgi:hypothetical protein